jgi:uncharacterized membrane protein YhaH (DUF805 family)
MFVLINAVILAVLTIVENVAGLTSEPADEFSRSTGYLSSIYALIVFIPNWAVIVRRLHDVGKSGWLLLIGLTCIGVIPLFIWSIASGNDGDNQYGPSPREIDGPAPAAEGEAGKAEDEETDEEA